MYFTLLWWCFVRFFWYFPISFIPTSNQIACNQFSATQILRYHHFLLHRCLLIGSRYSFVWWKRQKSGFDGFFVGCLSPLEQRSTADPKSASLSTANGRRIGGFKSPIFPSFPFNLSSKMANSSTSRKRTFPFSIDAILSSKTPKIANNEQFHWALAKAEIRLEGAALWRRFHALGTEMIVTRSGRRMFPTMQCSLRGLEPEERLCAYSSIF